MTREENKAGTEQAPCGVIVTYNPPEDFNERAMRLAECLSALFIIDNGSKNWAQTRTSLQHPNIIITSLSSNVGLGAALNMALEKADHAGFRWLLTLDQDSWATPAFVLKMSHELMKCESDPRVVILAPLYCNPTTGNISIKNNEYLGNGLHKIDSVITSGSVVHVKSARSIGGFKAAFFIDWLDHEFCLRAKLSGYKILQTHHAVLEHSIGFPCEGSFLLYKRFTTNHSPLRRYYMFRNWLWTLRHYWHHIPPKARSKEISRMINLCKKILLVEPGKWLIARAIFKGLLDGLKGRLGPINPSLRD